MTRALALLGNLIIWTLGPTLFAWALYSLFSADPVGIIWH